MPSDEDWGVKNLPANAALLAEEIRQLRKMLEEIFVAGRDEQRQSRPGKPRKEGVQNKILNHPEARKMFSQLYIENVTYDVMLKRLNMIEGFNISRSAIARTWMKVASGEVEL